mmetsp:Transcript_17692/g.41098  ORF Transcript_17692/g.41098 Transcript_17692/m.41098 type:complete len:258 (-) Transcript_17692:47-820(-)
MVSLLWHRGAHGPWSVAHLVHGILRLPKPPRRMVRRRMTPLHEGPLRPWSERCWLRSVLPSVSLRPLLPRRMLHRAHLHRRPVGRVPQPRRLGGRDARPREAGADDAAVRLARDVAAVARNGASRPSLRGAERIAEGRGASGPRSRHHVSAHHAAHGVDAATVRGAIEAALRCRGIEAPPRRVACLRRRRAACGAMLPRSGVGLCDRDAKDIFAFAGRHEASEAWDASPQCATRRCTDASAVANVNHHELLHYYIIV